MIRMPGPNYRGLFLPLTEEETIIKAQLERDVAVLAGEIGERNVQRYQALCSCADFLETSFIQAGYTVRKQEFAAAGKTCSNLEVEIQGNGPASGPAREIVVVGAHYDTVNGSPGANDNGSAVAALLALARMFSHVPTAHIRNARTLRFVAFANEEAPFFMTEEMGSLVYARACRDRGDRVAAMISLETIGYYSDEAGSQHYPFPLRLFYPSIGNFIGFVGNTSSKKLVRRVTACFREQTRFPSQGAAFPELIRGIAWSDQWSFWQQGYPALMVTDTAPFRYPHYHRSSDTADKIQYGHLARVVLGLRYVLEDLAQRTFNRGAGAGIRQN